MKSAIYKTLLKSMMAVSYRLPFLTGRVGHSLYPYMFNPQQLMFIADAALKAHAKNPRGYFIEAGCAYGATTIFLNKLVDGLPYHSIDTFSGFTAESIAHESDKRGKDLGKLKHDFVVNSEEWYRKNLEIHGVKNVKILKSDVTLVDFSKFNPIAFCLLDVDLYLPIAACLPPIYENLAPGGLIIVDDCRPDCVYDGAEQAYREFCRAMNLPYNTVHGKLGIIEKPVP
jgi:O-methyltransferase